MEFSFHFHMKVFCHIHLHQCHTSHTEECEHTEADYNAEFQQYTQPSLSPSLYHSIVKVPAICLAYLSWKNFTLIMYSIKIHSTCQLVFSICNVNVIMKVRNVCIWSIFHTWDYHWCHSIHPITKLHCFDCNFRYTWTFILGIITNDITTPTWC